MHTVIHDATCRVFVNCLVATYDLITTLLRRLSCVAVSMRVVLFISQHEVFRAGEGADPFRSERMVRTRALSLLFERGCALEHQKCLDAPHQALM